MMTGNPTPSIKEIDDALEGAGYSGRRNGLVQQIERMVEHGVLLKHTTTRQFDPVVIVRRDKFEHRSLSLEDTNPETQALYTALGRLGIGAKLQLDEVISLAQEVNPDIDPVKLRTKLRMSMGDGSHSFRVVEPEQRGQVPSGQRTVLEIPGTVKEPIRQLVEGVERLIDGRSLDYFTERCKQILSNPQDVSTLVAKARNSSPNTRKRSQEETMEVLHSILGQAGASTAKELSKLLSDKSVKPYSRSMVIGVLNKMVDKGEVVVSRERRERFSKFLTNVYSLPVETSQD